MKKLLMIVCILLTLCSCSYTAIDSEHSDDITTSESNQAASDNDDFEEVSKKYPDKTVLVWAIEGYIQSVKTSAINEYLDSLGCDFAVCFLPVADNVMCDANSDKTTLEQIKKMTNEGQQLDIVYSVSLLSGTDDCINSYHSLVKDGALIPLDDYLANTEIGKNLYSLMPEKHWEGLKVSGQIYGVSGAMSTLSCYTGYSVDKTIADEYGFDVNASPLEQLDILSEIAKEHTVCFPQYFNFPNLYSPAYLITWSVYWDNSEGKAKCILENEGFLRNLETYYTLRKNGFVSERNDDFPFIYFEGNQHGSGSATYQDRYGVYDSNVYITPARTAIGISVNSKHPDKAFELLALSQTDPYLNNLLAYGVEGEDYTLAGGKADCKNSRYSLRCDIFANKLICLPDKYSPTQVSEIYRQTLENAELPSCIGFILNVQDILETINKADYFFILNEFGNMLNSDSYESFDALIQACKAKLDEYGMKELTDEINRQYEEWKNENN